LLCRCPKNGPVWDVCIHQGVQWWWSQARLNPFPPPTKGGGQSPPPSGRLQHAGWQMYQVVSGPRVTTSAEPPGCTYLGLCIMLNEHKPGCKVSFRLVFSYGMTSPPFSIFQCFSFAYLGPMPALCYRRLQHRRWRGACVAALLLSWWSPGYRRAGEVGVGLSTSSTSCDATGRCCEFAIRRLSSSEASSDSSSTLTITFGVSASVSLLRLQYLL
jgi:hypothetical protein